MKSLLASFNAAWKPGQIGFVVFGIAAVAVLSVFAVLEPGMQYATLVFVFIGCAVVWRHFIVWRRRRQQRGIELLGTDAELTELGWPSSTGRR